MFRIKKGTGGEDETVDADRPEAEEPAPPKSPPRRAAPMPARPLGSPGLPVEIGRRNPELPGSARVEASGAAAREKSLLVGKGVTLRGEVQACERMSIEGDVQLSLSGCRHLHIGHAGTYKGTADVAEADVAGQFEGELIVRERLLVRPTGRIKGTLRYGQIVIEAGGQVVGDICSLEAQPGAAAVPAGVLPAAEEEPRGAAATGSTRTAAPALAPAHP